MSNLPKHVIEDLIPAYLAGDVSEQTKTLIEAAAQDDKHIAELIESDDVQPLITANDLNAKDLQPSDSLEFETLNRIKHSIRKKMLMVVAATIAILMLPLTAMNFTNEVNWGLMDFIVMGVMLIGAGAVYVFVSNLSKNNSYKLALAMGILSSFLLLWASLAVGVIGAETHSSNLLYLLFYIVVGRALFKNPRDAKQLAQSMFLGAAVLILIPILAMMFFDIVFYQFIAALIVSSFFASLCAISGWLFNKSAKELEMKG